MGQNRSSDSSSGPNREYTVEQLKELERWAEHYVEFVFHLKMLKDMSKTYGPMDEKNNNPWRTIKEGSYYLQDVYPLMEKYMEYNPDKKYNKYMESVITTMQALGFHPSYNTKGFTDEAYGGTVKCFVSKGQGTMYYKLLHSDYKKDVRFFVDLVERDIDAPIKEFLESIKQKLYGNSSLTNEHM